MNSFAILNSRKRAIIALIHTIVFLCVAALQTALSHASAFSLHGNKVVGGIVLLAIYTMVTTVLLVLLRMASHAIEQLYFALCATSAVLGLLRVLLGDRVLHAGGLRVFLLSCATLIGLIIVRTHSRGLAIHPTGEGAAGKGNQLAPGTSVTTESRIWTTWPRQFLPSASPPRSARPFPQPLGRHRS